MRVQKGNYEFEVCPFRDAKQARVHRTRHVAHRCLRTRECYRCFACGTNLGYACQCHALAGAVCLQSEHGSVIATLGSFTSFDDGKMQFRNGQVAQGLKQIGF